MTEEARQLGIPEEAIAALKPAEQFVEVWPENAPALNAFLAVKTQWRTVALQSGAVHFVGLDYASVDVALRNAGITVTPGLWGDITTMEDTARAVLNGVATGFNE